MKLTIALWLYSKKLRLETCSTISENIRMTMMRALFELLPSECFKIWTNFIQRVSSTEISSQKTFCSKATLLRVLYFLEILVWQFRRRNVNGLELAECVLGPWVLSPHKSSMTTVTMKSVISLALGAFSTSFIKGNPCLMGETKTKFARWLWTTELFSEK